MNVLILALAGGTLYPSPDARPIVDGVVLIRDGKIAAAGPRASVTIPRDARVINCSGNFLTAGLWNSHVHLFTPELLHARESSAAALTAQLDTMLNRWGFTTVFDIASLLENTLALRRRIESGEVRGPRVLTTGEPLWTEVPVYVRGFLEANHIAMAVVATPAEAAERVRRQAAAGADGIKLFAGSIRGRGKVANMPVEMVRAAVAEAHARHLPVFAHPQNSAGLEAAIAGGVDILAHTAPDSPPWTPAFAARLTQARMALIPTLTLFDWEARRGGESDAAREGWLAKMEAELRVFSQAGGDVLFGTDAGYIDHFDTAMEYDRMARAGMTFPQILASLTTAPARRFGYGERSGRIAPGMDADVTVLRDDPAKDITALARVRLAVRAGTVIYGR
ncbi:MAG TPA: amidohydrolase family protein [Candidatus Acidoferrales bacterium]|nr:amidohydrolase family protein [Candidatus Acidoferrales bacterium]